MDEFAINFRCLACGTEIPASQIKFQKSKRYSRKHRKRAKILEENTKSSPDNPQHEPEINPCPKCGFLKGFQAFPRGGRARALEYKQGDLRVVDLFCGCGGLSEGFQGAGFHTVAGLDVNINMVKTFAFNHPGSHAILGDITCLAPEDLFQDPKIKREDIALVMGGPPCQGFSTVGDRHAADPRNRLFYEFVRFVEEINPPLFLMENVPGLLTMQGGLVREIILKEFQNIGYEVAVKLLDASRFGVPQKRKRVFFLGNRVDIDSESLFPPEKESSPPSVDEAIGDLPPLFAGEDAFRMDYNGAARTEYQHLMRKGSEKIFNHKSPSHSPLVMNRIRALSEGQNHQDLPKTLQLSSGYPNIYGRLWGDRPADVITGNFGCVSAPGRFIHPHQDRVLSVREGARLQSFPDDFIVLGRNQSIQYKQVGNAVPPLLARSIAKKLREILELNCKK